MTDVGFVHRRLLQRIADTVRKARGGSLWIATCAGEELRQGLEAALAEELGDAARVLPIRWGHEGGNPAGALLDAARERAGQPAAICVSGFGSRADGEDGSAYAGLNLARDVLAGLGAHVLVWLEGIGELDGFVLEAPDLWSFRSGVASFLSAGDFEVEVEEAEPGSTPEERLAEVERRLEGEEEPKERAWLLLRKGWWLRELHRLNAALKSVEEGLELAAKLDRPDPLLGARLLAEHAGVLVLSGRTTEALGTRRRALLHAVEAGDLDANLDLSNVRLLALGERGDEPRALGAWRHALALARDQEPRTGLLSVMDCNAANICLHLGDPATAARLLDEARAAAEEPDLTDDPSGRAMWLDVTAQLRVGAGAPLEALRSSVRAARHLAALGRTRLLPWVAGRAASTFAALGLMPDAVEMALRVGASAEPPALALPSWVEGGPAAGSGMADEVRQGLYSALAAQDEPYLHLQLATRIARFEADALRARGGGPPAPAILDLLPSLLEQARSLDFDEGEGALHLAAAELHLLLGELDQAREHFAPLPLWCIVHRGPEVISDVWRLAGRIAHATGDLDFALVRYDDAEPHCVDSQSFYARMRLELSRAETLVTLDRPDEARARGGDVLDDARRRGLRIEELELLLELAELPPGSSDPDPRSAQAREALAIAREVMYPREEARALLSLVDSGLDAGGGQELRGWLEEAAEIVHHLGPPQLVPRVALLRQRLENAGSDR